MESQIDNILEKINFTNLQLEMHETLEQPKEGDVIGLKRWSEQTGHLRRKLSHLINKALHLGTKYDIIEAHIVLHDKHVKLYFTNISLDDVKTLVKIKLQNEKLELKTISYKEIKTGIFY